MSITGLGGLGGLVSGMDSKTMIEKLMMIEAQPLVSMKTQQKKVELRKGLLQEINSALLKLKTKVEALADAQKVMAKKVTSSDDKVAIGTAFKADQVIEGSYDLKVEQLATAWTAKSANITSFANPTTKELGWSGTFKVQYTNGTKTQVSRDITIEATDRLTDIAAKINASLEDSQTAGSMKVKATVVDNTLIMTSGETGAGSSVQILNDTAGIFGPGKLGLTDGDATAASFTSATVGKNSKFTVNGIDIERSKNSGLNDVIQGLEITLLQEGKSVNLKVEPDYEASEKVIQEFIDAYNSTMELLTTRMNEKTEKDAKSDTMLSKGLLRGDPALSSIQSALRDITGKAFSGSEMFKTLNSIGIRVDKSDNGVSGKLYIDTTKLREALSRNPNEVMKVFYVDGNANGKLDVDDNKAANGLAGMMFNKLFTLTDTTKVLHGTKSAPKGLLPSRMELMDGQVKEFNNRMESFNRRLDMRRKTLEAQFTSMEMMMQQSNSAGTFMMARMNSTY